MVSPHAWPWFCYDYSFVSLLPCSYHRLMVVRYCNKQEKFHVAKQWSVEERRLVHELERVMDVDLFLDIQNKWAEDSPHHLVILYEMFWHAAIKGQKEAEWIICWGHQQNMPQLNPEAGIPAIQLVGLQTTKEELLEIYLEVYKLHRLPRSPPGEPAILEEIMASVPDHPWSRRTRLLKLQHSLILEAPTPLGVVSPTEEGMMIPWCKVKPRCIQPIRRC